MKNTICIVLSLLLCITPLASTNANAITTNDDISTYRYTRASDINFYCSLWVKADEALFYVTLLKPNYVNSGSVVATLEVYDPRYIEQWRTVTGVTKTVHFTYSDGTNSEVLYTGSLPRGQYRLKCTVSTSGYNTTTKYSESSTKS